MKKLTIIFAIFAILTVQSVLSQTKKQKDYSKLDQFIQLAFDSIKLGKWREARIQFEEAQKVFEKETQASELLFEKFSLPDEDNFNPPTNETEKQILGYRHTVATKQALLQFLSFSYQLEGNSAEAKKYHDAVYALQGPLWGLSWKVFVPQIYRVFNSYVQIEKSENFGKYQYLAGVLLLDAGDKSAFDVVSTAQQNAPKDADIAALLTYFYLSQKNPKEAKKQAELSLSVRPNEKSVLIDLATAEWLLGELDNSAKHAKEVIKLDSNLPGPHATLALIYLEKDDFVNALKEAEIGANLSRRHPFYLTLQASALEASGKTKEAEKLMNEAWQGKYPSAEDLGDWYLRGKPLQLIMKIITRLK